MGIDDVHYYNRAWKAWDEEQTSTTTNKRINAVCDICGVSATCVTRFGGRTSMGHGITGPNLYGCEKHDLRVIHETKR